MRINNAFTTLKNAMEASKLLRYKTRAWEVPDHRRRLEAVALFIRLMKVLPGTRVPPPTCPSQGVRPLEGTSDQPKFREVKAEQVANRPDYKAQLEAVRSLIRVLRYFRP